MKTLPNTEPDARKFPHVDCHYYAPMLNGSSAACKTSKSLRNITRDYFDGEADREFISEAAVFTTLIVAMAVVPIVTGISAMVQLLSSLPLF